MRCDCIILDKRIEINFIIIIIIIIDVFDVLLYAPRAVICLIGRAHYKCPLLLLLLLLCAF